MIFSSLACLFSLCTQVLFTWIKDGKINNNTTQTGTCKIPTHGMTAPRPVAPAFSPILFLSAIAHRSCLTQPVQRSLPGSSPSLQLLFSRVAKWNPSFPRRTSSRRWEERGTQASEAPLALLVVWLPDPLLVHPSGHSSHHLIFSLALTPPCHGLWEDVATWVYSPLTGFPSREYRCAAYIPSVRVCSASGD